MLGTTLVGRIESAFDTLSGQLQRAARFVADHPAEVAMHSMRRVASQAGVAPATMLRLARRLGLEDYETLRGICRDVVRRGTDGSPFAQRGRALQSRNEDQRDRGLLADFKGGTVLDVGEEVGVSAMEALFRRPMRKSAKLIPVLGSAAPVSVMPRV